MAIPEQFVDELVARSEISEVVSSYVHLTRKGSNLWGLCPFHNEKTPSFSVSPDKQIYHCFGCGKGGGVISFIMEIENLPFPDAVRLLAASVPWRPISWPPAFIMNGLNLQRAGRYRIIWSSGVFCPVRPPASAWVPPRQSGTVLPVISPHRAFRKVSL